MCIYNIVLVFVCVRLSSSKPLRFAAVRWSQSSSSSLLYATATHIFFCLLACLLLSSSLLLLLLRLLLLLLYYLLLLCVAIFSIKFEPSSSACCRLAYECVNFILVGGSLITFFSLVHRRRSFNRHFNDLCAFGFYVSILCHSNIIK